MFGLHVAIFCGVPSLNPVFRSRVQCFCSVFQSYIVPMICT